LRNLYKRVAGTVDYDKGEALFAEKYKQVLDYLKTVPPSRRTTVLAALVVLTAEGEAFTAYRDQVLRGANEYSEGLKNQEVTDTQKNNWASQSRSLQFTNNWRRRHDLCFQKVS
jgi:hypothetical protein